VAEILPGDKGVGVGAVGLAADSGQCKLDVACISRYQGLTYL
jgi:hypothetical protein